GGFARICSKTEGKFDKKNMVPRKIVSIGDRFKEMKSNTTIFLHYLLFLLELIHFNSTIRAFIRDLPGKVHATDLNFFSCFLRFSCELKLSIVVAVAVLLFTCDMWLYNKPSGVHQGQLMASSSLVVYIPVGG
ncbi:hypothetical protein ACJX0J_038343, partial [Zea mays]